VSIENDLQGDVSRVALMCDLIFDEVPVFVWSRTYQITFEGKVYAPIAGLGGGLVVRQSLANKSLNSTAAISGHAPELLALALTSRYQNRPARLYLATIDEAGLILNRELIFNGLMETIDIEDDGVEPRLDISIRSKFGLLEIPSELRYTPGDQKSLHGDDSFFDFIVAAQSGNNLDPGNRNPSTVTN
jgi:hypothetical protein